MGAIEQSNEQFDNALMPPIFRVQLVRENRSERMTLDGPVDAARILCSYLENEDREHFVSMMLDVKNPYGEHRKLEHRHRFSEGSLQSGHSCQRRVHHRRPQSPVGGRDPFTRGLSSHQNPQRGWKAVRYRGPRPCHRRRGWGVCVPSPIRLLLESWFRSFREVLGGD